MRFLLDHNVPAAVGNALRNRGHDVIFVTDVLPENADDPVVAAAAIAEERVLVSHDRDMRRVEKLISEGYRERYPTLSRLHLSCNEVASAERVTSFAHVIEADFEFLAHDERPMIVDVGERRCRLVR